MLDFYKQIGGKITLFADLFSIKTFFLLNVRQLQNIAHKPSGNTSAMP